MEILDESKLLFCLKFFDVNTLIHFVFVSKRVFKKTKILIPEIIEKSVESIIGCYERKIILHKKRILAFFENLSKF